MSPAWAIIRIALLIAFVAWARAISLYAAALPRVRSQHLSILEVERPKAARRIQKHREDEAVVLAVLSAAVAIIAALCGLVAWQLGIDLSVASGYARTSSVLLLVCATAIVLAVVAVVLPTMKASAGPARAAATTSAVAGATIALLLPIRRIAESTSRRRTTAEGGRVDDELTSLVTDEDTLTKLEPDEREMIQSIFAFGDTTVRQIMVPRTDMHTLPATATPEEAVEAFGEYGHTRIPLIGEDADEVVGVLYAKDLMFATASAPDDAELRIEQIAREAYFVPETMHIDVLLREFKKRKLHMAVAVDEFGGTAGLVTTEDVIEEIVGEIEDEYDEDDTTIRRLGPSVFIVSGNASLGDVNEELGLELPDEGTDTIAGFVYNLAGTLPRRGSVWRHGDVRFQVTAVSGQRIRTVKVLVRKPGAGEPNGLEEES